jgi:hypothetical protein
MIAADREYSGSVQWQVCPAECSERSHSGTDRSDVELARCQRSMGTFLKRGANCSGRRSSKVQSWVALSDCGDISVEISCLSAAG